MQIIHSDICGPFPVQSQSHKRYFVSFIDDFTQYAVVYFLHTRDEVFEKFQAFLKQSIYKPQETDTPMRQRWRIHEQRVQGIHGAEQLHSFARTAVHSPV
jgi:secreted Zn-dependent insulinase-like peptidase